MDVGSHGCASLSDAATWFGTVFDESTGHARSALADARVTAKLLKQVMDGDYRVSPCAQEIRQRWGMGERAQTRLSMKRLELSDFLLKLKGKGNLNMKSALLGEAFWMGSRTLGRPPHAKMVSTTRMNRMRGI